MQSFYKKKDNIVTINRGPIGLVCLGIMTFFTAAFTMLVIFIGCPLKLALGLLVPMAVVYVGLFFLEKKRYSKIEVTIAADTLKYDTLTSNASVKLREVERVLVTRGSGISTKDYKMIFYIKGKKALSIYNLSDGSDCLLWEMKKHGIPVLIKGNKEFPFVPTIHELLAESEIEAYIEEARAYFDKMKEDFNIGLRICIKYMGKNCWKINYQDYLEYVFIPQMEGLGLSR